MRRPGLREIQNRRREAAALRREVAARAAEQDAKAAAKKAREAAEWKRYCDEEVRPRMAVVEEFAAEQRRLKELYRRASNELRQRHVAAVALENKAIDIRKRQKRRKELKPQLTDLFSARRGVPPELIQNILTFVGYDLVQADAPAYDLMRDDPREVDPSALKK